MGIHAYLGYDLSIPHAALESLWPALPAGWGEEPTHAGWDAVATRIVEIMGEDGDIEVELEPGEHAVQWAWAHLTGGTQGKVSWPNVDDLMNALAEAGTRGTIEGEYEDQHRRWRFTGRGPEPELHIGVIVYPTDTHQGDG